MLCCWCFTTLHILAYVLQLVHQARQVGLLQLLTAALTDIWLLHDIFYIGAQALHLVLTALDRAAQLV